MRSCTLSSFPSLAPRASRANYGQMPLLDLVTSIVGDGDADALRELHDHRALFRSQDGRSVRLVEYVALLRENPLARRWCGYDDIVLDQAANLTVDKFRNLPTASASGQDTPWQGPDCRYYLRAFVDYATARFKLEPPVSAVDAEIAAAEMLRTLVNRHFHLSCLESRRRAQRLVRRYLWRIDGRALYLWLPVEMPGGRCRRWLEAHIPDVEPRRPGEQERVQAAIDRLLGHPRFVSVGTAHRTANAIAVEADPVGAMIAEEISVGGLARTIADEKAEGIEGQRPAIRQLGEERLRQLIQEIFDGLVRGDYQADRIAGRFGLSEATFSRFAGSRWRGDGAETAPASVPDLWRNTAQALATNPDFVAAAKAAGVWKRVTDVLNRPGPGRREHE